MKRPFSVISDFRIFDYAVFAMLLLCAAYFFISYGGGAGGQKVSINANGRLFEYPLSQNKEYAVEGRIGVTRVLVQDGRVRITDSPCQNKTCVHQGFASTIICLPNGVVVSAQKDEGFDALSQ